MTSHAVNTAQSSSRRLVWLIGGVVVAAFLAQAWSFRRTINDDAYITFRYSLNLARGLGPYYNAGEHVEGYTNCLLMLIVAGAIAIGGPDAAPLTAKTVGLLGGLLALAATYAWTRRRLACFPAFAPRAAVLAWAAPLCIALNAAFALNTMTGLETALFAGLLALGVERLDRALETGRWCGAGFAFALAALTRPEGAIMALAALLAAFATGAWRTQPVRRALSVDAVIVIAAVTLHTSLRLWLYDGEWLPNTYFAKTGGALLDPRAASYLWGFAAGHLGGPLAALPLLVILNRNVGTLRTAMPGLVICLLAGLQLLHTGPDWMLGYRPLVQYLPIWSVLAVLGVAAAADRTASSPHRATMTAGVVLGLMILSMLARFDVRSDLYRDVANSARGYATGHVALANWLHEAAAPGDTVALMDVGLIGFHNPALRILDVSGLTDRHIARAPGGLFRKEYDPAYVLHQRPRFIILVTTRPLRDGQPGPFIALTPMEGRIANHADFRAAYIRSPAAALEPGEYADLAQLFGARRVFNHADPKHVYLLTVYERR